MPLNIKVNQKAVIWFVLVLFIGSCISGISAWKLHIDNDKHVYDALHKIATHTMDDVIELLKQYRYGLIDVRGIVVAEGEDGLSRDLFRRYILSMDLQNEFPGARGFGFIKRIHKNQEAEFLAKARRDGKADFTIKDLSPYEGDKYVIQYIEPSEDNELAIGLNAASEVNRREAANTAARTGNATLTSPITILQAAGSPDQSFLIYLPIYYGVKTPSTLLERESQVYGWSYAPLLIKDVLSHLHLDTATVKITLSDTTVSGNPVTFFKSSGEPLPTKFKTAIERPVFGRSWQLELQALPLFQEQLSLPSSYTLFGIGIVFSIVFASFAAALSMSQQRKKAIATDQARLAAIVESAIDGIISKNLDGIVTSWNQGAQIIFGYTAEQAIGKKLAELIVPEELQFEETNILVRIRNGENISQFTTTRRRKDGSTFPASASVAPIRNANGVIIGAAKTVRDITLQKATEDKILELNSDLENQVAHRTAQLEQARRDLQTILDAVPSMIGYWDKNLINRVANQAFHDFFNLTYRSIPGMHANELLGDELFEENRERMAAALRGEQQKFNFSISTPDGEKHWLAHYLPDVSNNDIQGFHVIVHDITDVTESNKRLQNALHENHSLLDTINQQLLFSITNTEGKFIEVNEKFLIVSGYSREEVIGKSPYELNPKSSTQDFSEEIWKTLALGKPWHGEVCNYTKDGNPLWFDTVIAPFSKVVGKTDRFIALYVDITERKKAEDERAELNLLISNVLKAASEVAIIATDNHGQITIFNRGAEIMLGYSANELISKSSPARFHLEEEIRSRSKELSQEYGVSISGFRTFVHKSELEGAETRIWTYVRKDGTHLQVSLSVTTLRDTEGNITGYLGVATDVTEELQNKRALKSTIDQFTIATDIAELGVWSWTFSDNSYRWNDRMFEIFSIPKELGDSEITTEHWQNRIHPDDLDTTLSNLKSVVENGGIYDTVFRIIKPDQSIHFIHSRAQIERDDTGKSLKATGVNRDITTQKELETWLRQAKESADSASASKSAFLANMSHEIRTPMNAVLGMLQLVQQTELTLRQQDYIVKARTAAKSLLGLLNDILDFSKIDSGKLQLDRHPFELEPLMRDLGVILSGNQKEKEVEVIFDIDPSIPQILIGDRLRLQQILINLAGNALKFTNRGNIIITLKMIESRTASVRIHISISDTGIGISTEQLDRIFDGFVQAEASTTRRFGGTGLGLAISKRLVNLMDSHLYVESTLGIGSRFWFDVDFLKENSFSVEHEHQALIKDWSILVVDDNAQSREILVRSIKAIGAQVDGADSGLAAVNKLHEKIEKNESYDLAILDFHMPDMVALSIAKLLKNLSTVKKLPTIIMGTAVGVEELKKRNLSNITYIDFLVTPLTPQQLLHSIVKNIKCIDENPAPIVFKDRQKPLTGIRILVVEDNNLNRQVAYELLTEEGAIVELAEGGLEGVTKVMNGLNSFAVVLMDMQMPDIDGLEATRRIRADKRFIDLPILAMTANVSPADKSACIAAGMNAHLGKPIDMEEVVPAIIAHINGNTTPQIKLLKENNPVASLCTSIESLGVILKRFGGNIELYKKMLDNFKIETEKTLEKITSYHNEGNYESILMSLHSIKGTAGTMGAKELSQFSSDLERKLKSEERLNYKEVFQSGHIIELKALFNKCFFQLIDQVDTTAYIHNNEIKEQTLLSKIDWKAKLEDALVLLREDNLKAIDVLESLYELSYPDLKELLTTPLQQANELQYDLAIKAITQLLETV